MVITIAVLFLVAALICFVLAAWPIVSSRLNLIALGLAFFTAAELVGKVVVSG